MKTKKITRIWIRSKEATKKKQTKIQIKHKRKLTSDNIEIEQGKRATTNKPCILILIRFICVFVCKCVDCVIRWLLLFFFSFIYIEIQTTIPIGHSSKGHCSVKCVNCAYRFLIAVVIMIVFVVAVVVFKWLCGCR